jgi:hypothetical protein
VSSTLSDCYFCRIITSISTSLFFVGPTLFISFLIVHVILVESTGLIPLGKNNFIL